MKNRIRKICSVLFTMALVLLLAGCAGGAKIVANSDPAADFGAYKTFDFYEPLSTDRGTTRSILSGFMIVATEKELEARGLTRTADSPDLLVDFVAGAQEKIRVSSQPTTSMTMHRGRGRAGTWGGYSMGMSTQQVTQSTEGTVAIDVVDRKQNQLVWEAAATGRVTEKTKDNIGQVAQTAVKDMFARFPIQPTQ